jgi:hypothetical protein
MKIVWMRNNSFSLLILSALYFRPIGGPMADLKTKRNDAAVRYRER